MFFSKLYKVHNYDFEDYRMSLIEADVKKLCENFGNEFISVNCPACCSDKKELELVFFGLNYQRCINCRAVYVSPSPLEQHIAWLVDNGQIYKKAIQKVSEETKKSRKIYLYKKRTDFILEQLAKYKVRGRKIIDIGGGGGEMAEDWAERNLFDSITVVEPQSLKVNLPKVKVIKGFFGDCELAEKFDVITAFEVVEEILNPDKFLKKIKDSLNDEGIFIFSTPNIDGFEMSTLGKLSTAMRFSHIRLYNIKSIKILLERNGFEVLDIQTPGELDVEMVYKRFVEGKLLIENNPALRFLLEDGYIHREEFQNFLQKKLMSSHLKCVVKKEL